MVIVGGLPNARATSSYAHTAPIENGSIFNGFPPVVMRPIVRPQQLRNEDTPTRSWSGLSAHLKLSVPAGVVSFGCLTFDVLAHQAGTFSGTGCRTGISISSSGAPMSAISNLLQTSTN